MKYYMIQLLRDSFDNFIQKIIMKKIIRKSTDKKFECMCWCIFLTDEYEKKDNSDRRSMHATTPLEPPMAWAITKCPECGETVKVFI